MRRFITILFLALFAFVALTNGQIIVEEAEVLDDEPSSRNSNISIE